MLEVHVPQGLEVQVLSSAPETMAEDQLFYVGQKAFISKNSEVLVLEAGNGLDFPGGKIQEGEFDFEESLKREVKEETGLEISVGEPFVVWYLIGHKGKHEGKIIFLVGYKCKFNGGKVIISDEHLNFEWVNKDNYQKLDDSGMYFKALEKYFKGA